ncbi:MAG TPA: hypothetical protein VH143_05855 [Kofleriaceae bacterium]|nr:hypothetical protein [Kofleriaceae bacterium]
MSAKRPNHAHSPNQQLIDVQKTLDSIEALRAQAFQALKEERAHLLAEVTRIDEQLAQLDTATRAFSTPAMTRNARTPTSNRGSSSSPPPVNGAASAAISGRRTQAQMQAVQRKVLNVLSTLKAKKKDATNPTSLDLVAHIPNTTPSILARPLRHLIDAGKVKTHGARSGTRYFLAARS